jgi:hypothetical protein
MVLTESAAAELRLAKTGAVETLTRLAAMLQDDVPIHQFKAIEEPLRNEISRLCTMIRGARDG